MAVMGSHDYLSFGRIEDRGTVPVSLIPVPSDSSLVINNANFFNATFFKHTIG